MDQDLCFVCSVLRDPDPRTYLICHPGLPLLPIVRNTRIATAFARSLLASPPHTLVAGTTQNVLSLPWSSDPCNCCYAYLAPNLRTYILTRPSRANSCRCSRFLDILPVVDPYFFPVELARYPKLALGLAAALPLVSLCFALPFPVVRRCRPSFPRPLIVCFDPEVTVAVVHLFLSS